MEEFGTKQDDIEYIERKGSYGVAMQGDMVLVEMAKLGCFLPGGGIDDGETIEQALQREFIEETGYKIISWQEIGAAVEYQDELHEGGSIHTKRIRYFYLVELGEKGEPTYADGHKRPVERVPITSVREKMHLQSQWWAIEECFRIQGIGVGNFFLKRASK